MREHLFGNNVQKNYQNNTDFIDSPAKKMHKQSELFFLWFASNLTIGDFAVGFIPVILGLNLYLSLLAFLIGNLLGSAMVGIVSLSGPKTGLPQMVLGFRAFGLKFGKAMSVLQYINTLGWLTVNIVLASFAFSLAFHLGNYIVSIIILAIIIFVISFSGRKTISYFERSMSAVLGLIFIFIIVSGIYHSSSILNYASVSYPSGIAFGITLATSFSYIMSWAPYASDYSRFNEDGHGIFYYTFLGGFIASIWSEIAGMIVAIISLNPSGNPATDLSSVLHPYGIIGLFAIFLGGIAADAINLYSNSISLLTAGIKITRKQASVLGIIIAGILSLITYARFYSFYEDFLFILDYWITPWIGIMISDFFIVNKLTKFRTDIIPGFNYAGIISYLTGLLLSIPFMDPGVVYEGIISKLYLGGVDVSYYVSFTVALLMYPVITKIINKRYISNNAK
ncbi:MULTISPECIES: cytosine permease [Acidiplasma]|uniref:Allantoin permease n=5 Tax=Acidiplasma TaxID=507753 RepID=A0A0N8VKW9_9ARCH|nr:MULTISPECIES: cytosine permease [Acidiplasma]KJE49762.1 allantoin permease [Acidiplasma sp. MBA-1]KQB34892.1 allantoin permease [Acidiplasma cupricumulans]KQB36241.1 allantoin permease [Acidiplasma aeolicum]WMT55720.1 MAG: cytosine permease [Acidiplasma sp.]